MHVFVGNQCDVCVITDQLLFVGAWFKVRVVRLHTNTQHRLIILSNSIVT
jgi:hypothetical protein